MGELAERRLKAGVLLTLELVAQEEYSARVTPP